MVNCRCEDSAVEVPSSARNGVGLVVEFNRNAEALGSVCASSNSTLSNSGAAVTSLRAGLSCTSVACGSVVGGRGNSLEVSLESGDSSEAEGNDDGGLEHLLDILFEIDYKLVSLRRI